ncbi:hypothetical protein L7F22_028344 [Adiantum nelumboides]|nr:hypothetical protein [Adiantum nelumboides]
MPHLRLLGGCKDSEGIAQLLNRKWFLSRPDTLIHPVLISGKPDAYDIDKLHFSSSKESKRFLDTRSVFHVIRDDLLHPLMGGNKLRKLDALLPLLQSASVTDVVTCGGCQSGHAAALAVACAESGIRAHLLLRGERLSIPTGYNLISGMYGEVIYIPRSEYAERDDMLTKYARTVAGGGAIVQVKGMHVDSDGASEQSHSTGIGQSSTKVAVVKEGASDVVALLGLIRLVDYLSQPCFLGSDRRLQIVIDCGTGTTAIGVALAILVLRCDCESVSRFSCFFFCSY